MFKERGVHLGYNHDVIPAYNTENRVQKRERDGWSGIQVIQRTIDGIFYTSNFGLIKPLTKVSNFDELVKQPRLTSLVNDIKESKGNHEKTDALLQDL